MAFQHAKDITELEEICLIEFKEDFEKMQAFAKNPDPKCENPKNPFRKPDPYAEKIFGDWIEYCKETIKLHQRAFENEQALPGSLKEENAATGAAIKVLDEYGEGNPLHKEHIAWLIKLLEIEVRANNRILEQLGRADPDTLCKR